MFAQFIKEKQYLQNVTPATVEWYRHSLKWLVSPSPSKAELQDAVMRMREKGLKATGANSAIRAINSYLHWKAKGADIKCGVGCQHLRVAYLKEPDIILPTFTLAQVTLLTRYKPHDDIVRRHHAIVLTLLDTGCRIDEVLSLRVSDVDMQNLLLTVTGKGRKQRRIPFSFELRRVLMRYTDGDGLLFRTRTAGNWADGMSCETPRGCAGHSASIHQHGRSMPSGTRSQSTISVVAGLSSIFRRCSGIQRWR